MLEVYAYNAGKGDCIRLHFAGTHNIFIDSGVTRFSSMFWKICNQIKQSGETLDVLILTHMDDDHIGGILACLRRSTYRCPFNEVWMNHTGSASCGDRTLSVCQNNEVYARLKHRKIKILSASQGDCRDIAGAKINIFNPEETTLQIEKKRNQGMPLARRHDYHFPLSRLAMMPLPTHDVSQNNKKSIVFSFEFENRKLLFTGDAWAEDVVKAQGNYDLIKLPHHGSARNISEAYQRSICSANFLICTDGVSHPDKQTIAKLEEWYGEVNIYSPSAWWANGYFTGDDKQHRIHYYKREGLVIAW